MNKTTRRGDFSSNKEFKEGAAEFLLSFGFSADLNWNDKDHVNCDEQPHGKWKVRGFGQYQASDWFYRVYITHRCSKCGVTVMHFRTCDENGSPSGETKRHVIVG